MTNTAHAENLQSISQTAASNSAANARSRIVELMQKLESALAAASFERNDQWNGVVQSDLINLAGELRSSREEINSSTGLFAEVIQQHPRLLRRVEELKEEYATLQKRLIEMANSFWQTNWSPGVDEARQEIGSIIASLRRVQATESELIFEAIGRDIGGGD